MKPSLILTLALAMLPLSAFSEEARISCVSSDGKVKVEAVKLRWTSPYPRLDTDRGSGLSEMMNPLMARRTKGKEKKSESHLCT